MPQKTLRERLRTLLRPSATRSVASLVLIGFIIGVISVWGFNTSLKVTSTDAFCTSCHEMETPLQQLRQTSHFSNASGIAASCADCHVPHAFGPKMVRKIEAAREVWGSITGIIDTPEKYAAHTAAMKQREIARLRANDSQECRDCHQVERMLVALQSAKARQYHQSMQRNGKTCIDCHAGIAHPDNSAAVVQ
tara:strand:- start:47430 stop:48008 length:579 start_codon:yes stop_codon:yes gene_type:complete